MKRADDSNFQFAYRKMIKGHSRDATELCQSPTAVSLAAKMRSPSGSTRLALDASGAQLSPQGNYNDQTTTHMTI